MTNEQANQKYAAFYVTRYSRAQMRHIAVGKTHTKIEGALKAARSMDAHGGEFMRFIDISAPNRNGGKIQFRAVSA